MPQPLSTLEQFFLPHVSFTVNPANPVAERDACETAARAYAAADNQRRANGFWVEWDSETEPFNDDVHGPDEFGYLATLVRFNGESDRIEILGALGQVDAEPDDPYRRVVAAELMLTWLEENPPARPPATYSLAQTWPHIKPRPTKIGKGLRVHGTLGPITGCGRVWSTTIADSDADAAVIDCGPCITAIDRCNTGRRRTSYGASVSFENESFSYGVDTAKATEWRTVHNERERVSALARTALGLA